MLNTNFMNLISDRKNKMNEIIYISTKIFILNEMLDESFKLYNNVFIYIISYLILLYIFELYFLLKNTK